MRTHTDLRTARALLTSLTRAALALAAVSLLGCVGSAAEPGEDVGSAEEAICPAGKTLKGVDVSYYQHKIDWKAAQADGVDFAFARVTYGSSPDSTFGANWPKMKAAGVVRGAYHFYRPSQDPIAQANEALKELAAAGGLAAGDLPLALDVEQTEGVSHAAIVAGMHAWLSHVKAKTGRAPLIYTSPGFWGVLGNPKTFSAYPLWIAHWGAPCPTVPQSSWSNFVFWQEGPFHINGISGAVDGDYFNGSLAKLLAFAGVAKPKPKPEPDAGTGSSSSGTAGGEGGSGGSGGSGGAATTEPEDPPADGPEADPGVPAEAASCSLAAGSPGGAPTLALSMAVAIAGAIAARRRRNG